MAVNGNGRKVKGTFIIPLARIINRRKEIDWVNQGHLTQEDLQRVKERILASTWYDLDFFTRVSTAVYRLVGNNRPEGAHQFGEGIMWETLAKIYHASLIKASPSEALSRFASLYNGIFFNTGSVEFKADGQEAVLRIFDPSGIPVPEFFIVMFKSLLQKIARENQAAQVEVRCEEESLMRNQRIYSATFHLRWRENTGNLKKSA